MKKDMRDRREYFKEWRKKNKDLILLKLNLSKFSKKEWVKEDLGYLRPMQKIGKRRKQLLQFFIDFFKEIRKKDLVIVTWGEMKDELTKKFKEEQEEGKYEHIQTFGTSDIRWFLVIFRHAGLIKRIVVEGTLYFIMENQTYQCPYVRDLENELVKLEEDLDYQKYEEKRKEEEKNFE